MPLLKSSTLRPLYMAAFFASLPLGILTLLLTVYARGLGLSMSEIGIVLGSFFLARVVCQGPFGYLSDRLGRKPLLISGTLAYVFTFPLFPLVSGTVSLTLLRVLQGVGSAAFWPAAEAFVGDATEAKKRGEAIGLLYTVLGIGSGTGGLIGYLAALGLGIQTSFYVFLPTSLLSTYVVITKIRGRQPRLHLASSIGLRGLLSSTIVVLLILAFIDSFDDLFIEPLLVAFLKQTFVADFFLMGLVFAIYLGPSFILQPYFGRASDRVGRPRLIFLGLLGTGVSLLLLPISGSFYVFVGLLVVSGICTASTAPVISAFLIDSAPGHLRGTALGVNGTVINLADTIAPLASGLMWDNSGSQLPFYFIGAFEALGAAIALSLFLVRRPRDSTFPESEV